MSSEVIDTELGHLDIERLHECRTHSAGVEFGAAERALQIKIDHADIAHSELRQMHGYTATNRSCPDNDGLSANFFVCHQSPHQSPSRLHLIAQNSIAQNSRHLTQDVLPHQIGIGLGDDLGLAGFFGS